MPRKPRPHLERTEWMDILDELKDPPFNIRPEMIAVQTGAACDSVYRWMRGKIPMPMYRNKLREIHRKLKEKQIARNLAEQDQ